MSKETESEDWVMPDMQKLFDEFNRRTTRASNFIKLLETNKKFALDDFQVRLIFQDVSTVSNLISETIDDQLYVSQTGDSSWLKDNSPKNDEA